ncbi:hypothetical protein SAMN02910298_01709 [Pseudobutyrivibrio sp. YE44]|uniref:hypothetical protein n=1 Tax=Pseudobutyrivibrio sp. YE44 TaxID=1520802 RepID=UPI000882A3F1|nr:hypothetical protein [Pseudobutyrivibrio sp. YE44]SDB34930.1 hypothetical protein SAMN02910298_01709 [Pseudobutyrivibrio sp. YE44]
MINKKYVLIAATVLMLGAVAVRPAMAFLTDTHETNGIGTIHLNEGQIKIVPYEDVKKDTKIIKIKNEGDLPVYVRVKVFGGRTHALILDTEKSVDWTQVSNADGTACFEYGKLLPVGETTTEVYVKIDDSKESAETFNVVVVGEATANTKEEGTPDWEKTLPNSVPAQADDNGQGGGR